MPARTHPAPRADLGPERHVPIDGGGGRISFGKIRAHEEIRPRRRDMVHKLQEVRRCARPLCSLVIAGGLRLLHRARTLGPRVPSLRLASPAMTRQTHASTHACLASRSHKSFRSGQTADSCGEAHICPLFEAWVDAVPGKPSRRDHSAAAGFQARGSGRARDDGPGGARSV